MAQGVPGAVGDAGALAEEVQFLAQVEGGGEVEKGSRGAEQGGVALLVAPALQCVHESLGGLDGASGELELPLSEVDGLEGEVLHFGASEAPVCTQKDQCAFFEIGFLKEPVDVTGAVDGSVVVRAVQGAPDVPEGVVRREVLCLEQVVEGADLGEAVLVGGRGVVASQPGAVRLGLGVRGVQEAASGLLYPAEVHADAAEDVEVGGAAGRARQEGGEGVQSAVQVSLAEQVVEIGGGCTHTCQYIKG